MRGSATGHCLNCGAQLRGAFCSRCGQRAIAAYPTVGELVGDAWQELSGYDGRFARTFRILFGRPGALTVETLEGRRVRYITPVRLYLVASVFYFLVSAAVPNLRVPKPAVMPGSKVIVAIDPSGRTNLTPEQLEQALRDLERAPWWVRAVLRPILTDPVGFRRQFVESLPRVLFVLVPVFAGIVALFYRRRPLPQHLIFAIHLHAMVFVTLAVRELSQLARSLIVLRVFELAAAVAIVVYALAAFRRVYGESWPRVLAKALGIATLYAVAGMCALLVNVIWAAMLD